MKLLDIDNISCCYGDTPVISQLSFSLQEGQIACLLGASGCGKTTALRAIAGFEGIQEGCISIDNKVLSDRKNMVAPESRHIGMVFQDYALFPHLSVADNIAFGLKQGSAQNKQQIVDELLALIKLSDYRQTYPHQLSGGQQQRVALARALAPNPQLLLLDEPFSNLDTELRRSLSLEVRRILKARKTSAILVTHDRTEAFNVADVIGVMNKGQLSQWADAKTLFQQPADAFVASFICDGSFISGIVTSQGKADTLFGPLTFQSNQSFEKGKTLQLFLRPDQVRASLSSENTSHSHALVKARVVQNQFQGAQSLVSLQLENGLVIESSDEHLETMALEKQVSLTVSTEPLLAFPE